MPARVGREGWVDVDGNEPEVRGRELPAQRVAVGIASRLELLEVGELAHVDLGSQVPADRLLEGLAGREVARRQRPEARERLEGALPEQHLKPAGAHLQHHRNDRLRRIHCFRPVVVNIAKLPNEVIDYGEKT